MQLMARAFYEGAWLKSCGLYPRVHMVNRSSCSPLKKIAETFCSLFLPKEVKVGGQRFVRDRLRGPSDIEERRRLHLKFG